MVGGEVDVDADVEGDVEADVDGVVGVLDVVGVGGTNSPTVKVIC